MGGGTLNHWLRCIECGEEYPGYSFIYRCRRCRGLLEVVYDYEELKNRLNYEEVRRRNLSVWRYMELLPVKRDACIVSLGEGGTRLHRCRRLGERLGVRDLWVKMEGDNPTCSFKDRGMTVGVSKALEHGVEAVACASTGNTSASLAAYAAKAGLKCIVLVPSGKVAEGKLAQAVAHGAEIFQVEGNFDEALRLVVDLSEGSREIYLLNSINPYRIEGQKTLAFEVRDQLGRIPDLVALPVGNAGNISAIWKGFWELKTLGLEDGLPRLAGIQAEGASPIAEAFKQGLEKIRPWRRPETVATAIRIGAPVSWMKALKAVRDSHGLMETVSDGEILEAQSLLARLEGLFVEPASAASIAGIRKLLDGDVIHGDLEIVCVATGHGLKDPEIALRNARFRRFKGDASEIIKLLRVQRS
ncbi:MAG: threonine synthase [Candidatus Bathyarchaeia archaeon]